MNISSVSQAYRRSALIRVYQRQASANAIRKYTMLELAELGISWGWMGLESPASSYSKLHGPWIRGLLLDSGQNFKASLHLNT